MPHKNDRDETEQTARVENLEEEIYHLDLESELIDQQKALVGWDRENMICARCGGDQATWYTKQVKHEIAYYSDHGCVNTLWCDQCIPQEFVDLWMMWPWTPDSQL
ncbi:hypothetical protein CP556_14580 [Natrinema sp. CBA1119]|uniref:hypothetical protein n=1 Tax=unclassified Natrinema TaxID=2622230 RepID=UPI000BF5C792|nr:hypothetical protein [Natrinema sp. CBA1119]PGF17209.1 hypothetical protein CP556_14580 [Natrinema sp. CBA1119]